jgi:DNA-binding MarR family transcriptional regulator
VTEALPALGADIADTVLALRRAVRRVTRRTFAGTPLPPSEAELLAFVGRNKGAGVNDTAGALLLAPNTVSTLVGRLVTAGLLERRPDPDDKRSVRLHLTVAGSARVRAWRRHRSELLERALASLDRADVRDLERTLPAMKRLTEAIDRLDSEEDT